MTGCFHCGEPVPTGSDFTLEIKGIVQPMCCPGCQAVAQTILECGLASYYEHRTAPGIKGELVPSELAAACFTLLRRTPAALFSKRAVSRFWPP